jgi:hypothetical protein
MSAHGRFLATCIGIRLEKEFTFTRQCYIAHMGVIGPALFDDDRAADVRGTYRRFLEQGVDDAEALRRIVERYQRWLIGRRV